MLPRAATPAVPLVRWCEPERQAAPGARRNGAAGLVAWIRRCTERARQRRALAELDDHLLRDIGLTRVEAAREAAKRFWR